MTKTTGGRRAGWLAGIALVALAPGLASADTAATLQPQGLETVVVTARQRVEDVQKAPVSVSVVGATEIERTYTSNINQLSQLTPSLIYGSPNPRNTSFTIRGLGSSVVAIAQSNDGLEGGVGFYVDQVYHARPATAAFDFADIERVEVLRGPQGALFGKNTTAGAISVTTRAPTFDTEVFGEASFGDYDYLQLKGVISGPVVADKLAIRVSGALTRRDGVIRNVVTGDDANKLHTDGLRGELLYKPTSHFSLRLSADFTDFVADCCTQVYVRVGKSLKPAARQYPALAAGLNYNPPSLNPYDRLTDIDAALGVDTNEGGVSAIADWDLGSATLTSVSAWRWWNWDAANDRDYTGVPVQLLQHIPSHQDQYSQELRIASNGQRTIEYVAGLYVFNQVLKGEPITGYGPQAAYWLLGPAPATPANLLDGYTTDGSTKFLSNSYAAFGEATWRATHRLRLTGGLRYTHEDKRGRYDSFVFGGLPTTNPTLINSKLSILRPQSYRAVVSDGSVSGQANLAYDFAPNLMGYASVSRGFKSGGINMSGLPLNAANLPALSTAVVRPERNTTYELGFKSRLLDHRMTLNADVYETVVRDFQTNVVDTGPGALRGYLANIDKVRVRGAEVDAAAALGRGLSLHGSLAYTDGKYVSYRNGPCPLELIASSTTVCDLSGKPLSALPKWVWTVGGDFARPLKLGGAPSEAFVHAELTSRTSAYGDASDSLYTLIKGYTVVNASVGLRHGWWELSLWARNLFDRNYIQNLTVQAGNSGLIVGTPSDPRMIGATLRARY